MYIILKTKILEVSLIFKIDKIYTFYSTYKPLRKPNPHKVLVKCKLKHSFLSYPCHWDAIIQKWEDEEVETETWGKLEPSYVASGDAILWNHFGKQFGICFKMKHKLLRWPNTSISMVMQENKNICSWKTYMWMFTAVLFITKRWISFKVLPT